MSAPFELVALLPMKGHSARIPGKNFKEFAGKPLVSWILNTLLTIERVEKIVINTDARDRLAAVGVEDTERVLIRDRKPDLRGDAVSMNLILADDIEAVDARSYLMVHTTSPLLRPETIEAALDRFDRASREGCADSLFSVNKHQTRFYHEDGSPVNHDPENLIPTQDLEPWYEENSNLYLFTPESFGATNARIGRRPMMFETPKIESMDIDTEQDWLLSEAIAKSLSPRGF